MRHDLDWLLGDLGIEAFIGRYFEREPLYIGNRAPTYYDGIFMPRDLDAILYQSAELVRANLKTAGSFARGGENGAASSVPTAAAALPVWLRETLRGGESVLIGDAGRAWLPLGRLARQVEAVLLNPVAATLFLSPANARGFPIHFDTYDTMVLQISGEKDWTIYRPTIPLPAHSQAHSIEVDALGEPLLRQTLRPGDLLYMPRGFIHATSTNAAASMHVTLISLPYRWADLLHDLVDRMAEGNPDLRRHVPLAACHAVAGGAGALDGIAGELGGLLRSCADAADAAAPVVRHLKRFIDELTPFDDGIGEPEIPGEIGGQLIARKDGMICQVHTDGDRVVIRFPGGHLRGPPSTRPALQFIAAATRPFRLADLPGRLSQRSKGILVGRLIGEGLLRRTPD